MGGLHLVDLAAEAPDTAAVCSTRSLARRLGGRPYGRSLTPARVVPLFPCRRLAREPSKPMPTIIHNALSETSDSLHFGVLLKLNVCLALGCRDTGGCRIQPRRPASQCTVCYWRRPEEVRGPARGAGERGVWRGDSFTYFAASVSLTSVRKWVISLMACCGLVEVVLDHGHEPGSDNHAVGARVARWSWRVRAC